MIDKEVFRQFQEIGRDLYVGGLISSHGGNMSVRFGDRVVIKRRGAMLGRLREGDLIETGLEKPDSGIALASTELIVHRAIYLATPALAIIHAHPRTAIALSLSLSRHLERVGHLKRNPFGRRSRITIRVGEDLFRGLLQSEFEQGSHAVTQSECGGDSDCLPGFGDPAA